MKSTFLSGFLFLLLSFSLPGQSPFTSTSNPNAVATFECAGIYWQTPEAGICSVRYKKSNSSAWQNGLDLVFDSRNGEYRGSLINLTPASNYIVELSAGKTKVQLKFTTRNDDFPTGKKTVIQPGESDKTITITESGTPEAYHLVTAPDGNKSVINLKNVYDNGIIVDADYVIVRGIEIRNARVNGILIRKERHDVVVDRCFITFWGRIGGPVTYGNFEGNMDSGIYGETGTWNLTLQRNLIEDPRGASNDWETGHPAGPQGISIIQSKGGNVIRYNDIISTEDHGFNDGIGGSANFSDVGNVNRDSDVYGNIINNSWDNPIEVEGANMNVRVWGNYIDQYYSGIATASTNRGPIYIYRNIMARSRRGHRNDAGGMFIKTGDKQGFGGGKRMVFHNTILQPGGAMNIIGDDPNIYSRNNVFDVPGSVGPNNEKEALSDFDYDFYTGSKGIAKEEHGITGRWSKFLYVRTHNLQFYPKSTVSRVVIGKFPTQFGDRTVTITDPVLQVKSPLIDSGFVLKGFNEDFKGSAPDIGAFEVGNPPLEFGRRAYLRYNEGLAPWEEY